MTPRRRLHLPLLLFLAGLFLAPPAPAQVEEDYLAFGDSITWGFSTGEDDNHNGYPFVLEDLLDAQVVPCNVYNFGHGGDTTADGLARLPFVLAGGGDLILVMFGTNDINEGVSVSTMLYNLGRILDLSEAASVTPVISTIIPRINDPRDWNNLTAQALNEGILWLMRRPGVIGADNWLAFVSYPEYWSALYSDQVHPNPLGYRVMAGEWFDSIVDLWPLPEVTAVAPQGMENGEPLAVTISGAHFLPGALPYLDDYPLVAVEVVSGTTIRATVPAELPPGVYDVVVDNPGDNAGWLEEAFTIVNSPPVLTAIDPAAVEVGERVEVEVEGRYFDPTPQLLVGSVPFEHLRFVDSGHLRAVTPAQIGPGTYDLRLVNPDGQEALLAGAFRVQDTRVPEIANRYPVPGSHGASPNLRLLFNLRDSGTGVDLSSLVLRVNGALVTPTTSGSPRDYFVEWRPASPLAAGATVSVVVRASDLRGPVPNTLNALFSFTVSSAADADLDLLPDLWEEDNDLDPGEPGGLFGAGGDPDGDRSANLYEYQAGTDPTSPGQVVTAPGPGMGNRALLRIFDPSGCPLGGVEWTAYGAPDWGAEVAGGDIDGDGLAEVLTGPGPGPVYGPQVRGFEAGGTPVPGVNFFAYGTHRFGVHVAAGDIDGDGIDEILTGPGPGEMFGPHIRGWNGDGGAVTPVPGVSFLAYGTHKYGANVACGDIDGDGIDEIVTGPGPGAVFGPHVRGWNYDGVAVAPMPGVSFLAYGTHKYGVNVACGDLDGDGYDEIVTGAGPGQVFGAHVRGFNVDGASAAPIPWISFFAYSTSQYGVNVACGDLDGDRVAEIITGTGPGPSFAPQVRGWETEGQTIAPFPGMTFFAYDRFEFDHGVRVGAGHFYY